MLIRVKISNSRSIDKEIEFSAISSKTTPSEDAKTVYLEKYGVYLLKTMALFGANASGKSNILKAIADAYLLVISDSNKIEKYFNYCKNNKENSSKPTRFSFDILIENIYYNYTFAYTKEYIIEEKLSRYQDNHSEEVIYSRIIDNNNKYAWSPKEFFKNPNADYFYKSTPKNKLFLSVANTDVNSDAIQKIDVLEKVFDWFKQQVTIHISQQTPGKMNLNYLISYILESPQNKQLILKILEIADIYLTDIEIVELAEVATGQSSYRYTKPNGNQVYVTITTSHENRFTGEIEKFDFFEEESHGTQQFVAWIGSWLLALKKGKQPKIFIIDELGTNLHPLLNQLLIKLFYTKKINPYNSQLIFTSHEVKLMDKKIMRPDQLFLINKTYSSKEKIETTSVKRVSDFVEIDKYNRLDNLYMHSGISGVPSIQEDVDLDLILKDIDV